MEAINNIAMCFQMALLAGAVGIASVFWESYKRKNKQHFQLSISNLSVVEQSDLCFYAYDFIFAAGLYRVYRLFQNQSKKGAVDRMSPHNLQKLYQTISWLWFGVTVSFSLDGVIMVASELKLPMFMVVSTVFAFIVNFPVGEWFHRHSQQQHLANDKSLVAGKEYARARKIGLRAARDMLWSVGGIILSGVVDLMDFAIKTVHADSAEEKVGIAFGGLLDVSESITIGGLLASLYFTLVRVVITSTKRDFSSKNDASDFKEYYEAQSKFYGRVASFFGFQALFTILEYVYQIVESLWFK